MTDPEQIQRVLDEAVEHARTLSHGAPASYIPSLACAPLESTSAAIVTTAGDTFVAGDADEHTFTLQSSAKVLLLAGMLEDRGPDEVFGVVGTEPSGGSFASLARLEREFLPSNPLVNAGAIALSSLIEGHLEDRIEWIETWAERLYGERLPINQRVLVSERRTAAKNRAIAYLLQSKEILTGDVEDVLETYFALCSLETRVARTAELPALLARGGRSRAGEVVLSSKTVDTVVALMATCGMYNESGRYLVHTGLPAKSGVSGAIIALAPGRGGLCVSSPRLNQKGGSVRGHAILEEVSKALNWHFATPVH